MRAAPTATSVVERLRRERREQAIEDLLFAHPGLIDPALARPRRQVSLSADSRADLLFEFPEGKVVVEIKRGPITAAHVGQIERYAGRLRLPRGKFRGILVGTGLRPQAMSRMQTSPWRLEYRCLGSEVPLEIRICRQCRVAYDARLPRCPRDGVEMAL